MPTFPDDIANISITDQCRVYDYHTMAQAAAVLKAYNINVVVLVPQVETNAVERWTEFSTTYMGQPASFLQYIQADSSDIVEVVVKAMAEVSDY
ncbi:hypothetical protein GNI_138080, partial [Gregarina niphandrodes]